MTVWAQLVGTGGCLVDHVVRIRITTRVVSLAREPLLDCVRRWSRGLAGIPIRYTLELRPR